MREWKVTFHDRVISDTEEEARKIVADVMANKLGEEFFRANVEIEEVLPNKEPLK